MGTLPTGTWEFHQSGFVLKLNIKSVDNQGNVIGSVTSQAVDQKIFGFWNEELEEIVFVQVLNPAHPSAIQIHTGYLFTEVPGSDTRYYLAGSFRAFHDAGGKAKKSIYGWFATRTEIG